MKKKIFQRIKNKIKQANNIAIISHFDPDGDSLGSMVALSIALNQLKKKNFIITASYPIEFKWLVKHLNIITKPHKHYQPDLVFVLDSSDLNRVNMQTIFKKKPYIINIDHHMDNKQFGNINYIEECSSVGEMIYPLLKYFKTEILHNIAEALYVAITTDTGSFRYANTKESTFKVASELVKKGIKPYEVVKKVYENRAVKELDVYREALKNIDFVSNGKIVYTRLTSASKIEARSIIDFIRTVEGTEIVVVFKKLSKELYKISLRSKGKSDVNKIAKVFGGGGHKQASGCTIKGKERDIINLVLKQSKYELNIH